MVDTATVKVLTGLTVQEFEAEMQLMTQALGLSCGSCHARGNFASDANPRKLAARRMLEMTKGLNKQYFADYKPLDSFELINGKIENKSSVVEKKIGDVSYATVRVSATMSETWDLARFPFDSHSITVKIEDSSLSAKDLVFVADKSNSGLGDEIDMAGWTASNFVTDVQTKVYRTNYGDVSLPTNASSEYSRFMFSVDIERRSQGSAIKLLSTVLLATAVAFVAFLVKPSDLDARFGMGIGSLFAVTASAFISASLVPDSGEMTLADKMHMIALAFIFGTLLLSALCLKLEVSRRRELAFRIDRIAVVVLPLLFYGWAAWAIAHNIR
jgi:hypothetical protein